MPTISMATVYNCLETLVTCGLVKQVNIEREPTRTARTLPPTLISTVAIRAAFMMCPCRPI